MGTDEQGTGLSGKRGLQGGFADDFDIEEVKAVVEQVNPVMNGAGKGQDMAETVTPAGRSRECTVQVGLAGVARLGGKKREIEGDAIEHQTPDAAAKSERNPHHQAQDGAVAALLLLPPVRFHDWGERLPLATSRSPARIVKL